MVPFDDVIMNKFQSVVTIDVIISSEYVRAQNKFTLVIENILGDIESMFVTKYCNVCHTK